MYEHHANGSSISRRFSRVQLRGVEWVHRKQDLKLCSIMAATICSNVGMLRKKCAFCTVWLKTCVAACERVEMWQLADTVAMRISILSDLAQERDITCHDV